MSIDVPDWVSDCPVTRYSKDVLEGTILAGPYVRGACERHLRDLKAKHLFWDPDEAQKAIDFFRDVLVLSTGEFEGRAFELIPWQEFCVGSLYGWFLEDDRLRFRRAYIETGKGSGKTPMVAGLGLKGVCAEAEPRAEVYVIARTKEQTAVTFRDAVAMVHQSSLLEKRLQVWGGSQNPTRISHDESGSFMDRVSTDTQGKGKSGPIAYRVLCDEFHEQDSDAMLEFYEAGFKQRKSPLTIVITNAGVSMQSPCGRQHTYSARVAAGDVQDDSLFVYICALDDGDNPFEDEDCWIKTNPTMPATPTIEYLRDQVRKARGMPSKRSVVERLNFCRWVDAESPWIDRDKWMACEVDGPPCSLKGRKRFIALDLSMQTDLTSGASVWDCEEDGIYAEVESWTPEEGVYQRGERDGVPYDVWVAEGDLRTTPGNIVDFDFVAAWINEEMNSPDKGELVGVAFDPHKIKYLEEALDKIGIVTTREQYGYGLWMIPHGQGFGTGTYKAKNKAKDNPDDQERRLWMPRSIDVAEGFILEGKLRAKRNMPLRTAALGAMIIPDASENRRFSKTKALVRNDPIVALVMACGFLDSGPEEGGSFTVAGLYDKAW